MTLETFKNTLILSVISIGLGLLLIFLSINFGTSLADSWIAARGGANLDYYHIIVESYINTFLITGGILFGVGFFAIICSFCVSQLTNK